MNLIKLARAIGMPEEAVARLEQTEIGLSPERIEQAVARLTQRETYDAEANALKELLVSDEGGFRMLKIMLTAALRTERIYKERGIPSEIFLATMGCFSRFVREHKESFGTFGFDRWFWTGRQLSVILFRVGELEYELVEEEGKKAVSMHIPSDADLSEEAVTQSYLKAKEFLKQFAPAYAEAEFVCFSWLLAPALKEVLPAHSNILRFQRRFLLRNVDESDEGYKLWVFKRSDLRPEEFPEQTSLQRNLKKYVLAGGKVGHAYGLFLG